MEKSTNISVEEKNGRKGDRERGNWRRLIYLEVVGSWVGCWGAGVEG